MKRFAYNSLIEWKKSTRRKPLIMHGARQVGKTHLLKSFGKTEFDHCIYINFEEDPNFKNFFERNLNPKRILNELSLHLDRKIEPEGTLIIFDEIQECPNALTSLKYFNEDANEYTIVSASSLLGVKLEKNKGFPVGKVNFMDLFPLTFFEFLDAIDKSNLRQYLQGITSFEPIPEPIHQQLIENLKYYFFIGGMPEAVKTYAKNHDLKEVREIHKEILSAYLFDFAKHAPSSEVMKISMVWESIPSQLAKENKSKKFVFSEINKNARAREFEIAIQWLTDAGLVLKSFNVSTPKLPLSGYADKNCFKLYLLDVGLLGAMSNLYPQIILEGDALFTEFKGSLTENYAAQTLHAHYKNNLYYWTSPGSAEVDFLVPIDRQIYPLEVKSGISTKSKSLAVYQEKYNPPVATRTNMLNLKWDGKIQNYPLYLMDNFPI
jgi:predicted AAA+ superfamily ATPase